MYKKNPVIKRLETWLKNADQEQLSFAESFLVYNGILLDTRTSYLSEALVAFVNEEISNGKELQVKQLLTTMKNEWRLEKFKQNKKSINISLEQSTLHKLNELCLSSKTSNGTYSMVISELINIAHKKIKRNK